jgi:hypothetical protein
MRRTWKTPAGRICEFLYSSRAALLIVQYTGLNRRTSRSTGVFITGVPRMAEFLILDI